jgi:hypothetical protein
MFLDGDEWFEDTSELIEFFTSGECDKYGSAAYIHQKLPMTFKEKHYDDCYVHRVLRRMHPDICFVGSIHEAIVRI